MDVESGGSRLMVTERRLPTTQGGGREEFGSVMVWRNQGDVEMSEECEWVSSMTTSSVIIYSYRIGVIRYSVSVRPSFSFGPVH